jgi:hypothetical protein
MGRDSRIAPLFVRDADKNSICSQFVDAKPKLRDGREGCKLLQGTMGLSCPSSTLDSSGNGSAAARVERAQTKKEGVMQCSFLLSQQLLRQSSVAQYQISIYLSLDRGLQILLRYPTKTPSFPNDPGNKIQCNFYVILLSEHMGKTSPRVSDVCSLIGDVLSLVGP